MTFQIKLLFSQHVLFMESIIMHNETVRFTASLPKTLFEKMETELINKNYQSRSEYIRDLFRERLVYEAWGEGDIDTIGILNVIFNLNQKGLYEKVMMLKNSGLAEVLNDNHLNIDQGRVLQNIVLKGDPRKMNELHEKLSILKGIEFSKLTPCR